MVKRIVLDMNSSELKGQECTGCSDEGRKMNAQRVQESLK